MPLIMTQLCGFVLNLFHAISPIIQQTIGTNISPVKHIVIVSAVLISNWRNQRCWQNICVICDTYSKISDKKYKKNYYSLQIKEFDKKKSFLLRKRVK